MPPDEHDLRNRLERALAEGQRLREEVRRLKGLLEKHSIPFDEPAAFAQTCLPVPGDLSRLNASDELRNA